VANGAPDKIRVIVVSPGDVTAERDAVALVVDELSRRVASRGLELSLWRWETDARAGLHLEGPQGLIDERMDIPEADIVVGIFWKRFGTPTGEAQSGTEHELRKAWASWKQNGKPDVMVYFSQQPASPQTSAEAEQWHLVLKFREELPGEQFWWSYENPIAFERLVRGHLEDVVDRRLSGAPVPDAKPPGRAGPQVRFGLPLSGRVFVGRSRELRALEEALAVADQAVVTQAITGLGGVGKSSLAVHYVSAHLDEYDVVAWIRAEDGGTADLAELAGKLGEPSSELSPADRAKLALDSLAASERRWLLVLDNVTSREQLERCLPRSGNGRVLVTSRNRELRRFAPAVALDVLDEPTAVDYLIREAQRPDDQAGAERLAEALGYLPLALAHAAAYCANGTSFDEYLELLRALPSQQLFDAGAEASHEQTVDSTWRVSIEAACADAPLAGDVLALASHLGPDAIPKSLFATLIDTTDPRGRKALTDAFNSLARFSLLTVEDTTCSMHRLLQKVVRDDALARGDQLPARWALTAVTQAFPTNEFDASRWPLCEQLLPHVTAVADAFEQLGDPAVREIVLLLNTAARYLFTSEGGQRAVALFERTRAKAEMLGPHHPLAMSLRNNVAAAYFEVGRNESAVAAWEAVLAYQERMFGTRSEDTFDVRTNLAAGYSSAGRVNDAIAIYEPLLEDLERILGPEHEKTLNAQHGLAGAYSDSGRLQEAITIYESVLAERKLGIGPEHLYTLRTGGALARAYLKAGRLEEATTANEEVLLDRERVLGKEHPDTLVGRRALAETYRASGRIDEAIAMLEVLVADQERILDAGDEDIRDTRRELAVAYRLAGRLDEAIAILEAIVADGQPASASTRPAALRTRRELAVAYRVAGRVADAIGILEALVNDERRILDAEHTEAVATRSELDAAYAAAGRG
jgi:tetratricopeptide (TPR) repeat protein